MHSEAMTPGPPLHTLPGDRALSADDVRWCYRQLLLREPDIAVASRIAVVIDSALGAGTARVDDPGSVTLTLGFEDNHSTHPAAVLGTPVATRPFCWSHGKMSSMPVDVWMPGMPLLSTHLLGSPKNFTSPPKRFATGSTMQLATAATWICMP